MIDGDGGKRVTVQPVAASVWWRDATLNLYGVVCDGLVTTAAVHDVAVHDAESTR